MTPEAIDAILADFRAWLTDLSREPEPKPTENTSTVDLFTLVGQFTALRHDVNMQTRAVRTAVEQNAESLRQLSPEPRDDLRPIAKGLIDIADALILSLRHLEKFNDTAEPLLAELGSSRSTGLLAKLFGTKSNDRESAIDKLRQLVAAAADGYSLSLRRVERMLPELELEAISCVGEMFDPETMEALEVTGDTGEPSGTVVEELRPGYRWRGQVLRFAQVKVAR